MKLLQNYFLFFTFFFCTGTYFSQTNEIVYRNNEAIISIIEFDSIYSIFKVERYNDESHHFGILEIDGDTAVFTENIDTFLLVEPKIFYEFDDKIPIKHLKIESRISFWEAPEWMTWLHDVNYIINDSLIFQCKNVFENSNEFHELLIPIQPQTFNLKISTADIMISESLYIDLQPKEFYRNFKITTIDQNLYNHVIVQMRIVGTMPLPGLSFDMFAPEKIVFKGKEYFFRTKIK